MVHLLEHLSFGIRCLSFLLSKFASQFKLIQSVVRVGILWICVTSSILRVLISGFWVSGSQVQRFRDPVLASWVSRFRISGSQSPGSQGPRSQVLGTLVLILDYAFKNKYNFIFFFLIRATGGFLLIFFDIKISLILSWKWFRIEF